MRTRVYIDGFNLYYGAVRRTPYRWLNVARMCEYLLPGQEIVGYKYFTALVKPRPSDLDKRRRQRVFIRALMTIPTLEVILGHFLTHEKRLPLSSSPVDSPRYVTVWVTEEKGSDVNLATHLLNDAHLDRFDDAVIVSNDSDLLLPIQVVMEQYGRRVGILNPQVHPSKVLARQATFIKRIRTGVLAASQFPATMTDHKGSFYKPPDW